ncbi:hypothetical protein GTO91_17365, partial [Heliobacterium undosum]
LEPSILFITDLEWNVQEKRDLFLENLYAMLDFINDNKVTQINWNDELESFLWNDKSLPPWRADKNWKNKIVPTIYQKIHPNFRFLDDGGFDICDFYPGLQLSIQKEITYAFLKLVHSLIDNKEDFYLCLGIPNKSLKEQECYFYCDCHPNRINPSIICEPKDWVFSIGLSTFFWPESIDESNKVRRGIEFVTNHIINKPLVYNYQFSEDFIGRLVQENEYLDEILIAIAKRLTLIQSEASRNKGLKDEPVRRKKTERRFRVLGERRIHYTYIDRDILFLKYFGEGEHDDGL